MPIVEDFLINLAAGFTQTLLQYAATRALGDPQRRALRSAYQAGFEHMLRTAGSGLSQAELGQISDLFQNYLGQSEVANAFLNLALRNLDADIDSLVTSFYRFNNSDSLVNIRFDLNRGLLAFKTSLGNALIAEAKQTDSPLANLASISMLEEVLRRTQDNSERVLRNAEAIPLSTSVSIANFDLRRPVTEVTICRSSPKVLYALIGGTLFVSRDGALTWNPASQSAGLIAADPVNPNTIYALRTTGIHVSEDFGESWRLRSGAVSYRSFTGGQLNIHPEDSRKMLYADALGVHVSTDEAWTWRNCFPERRANGSTRWHCVIDTNQTGTIVAALSDEGIYVTDDWGQSWEEIAGPSTGDRPHPGIMQPLAIDSEMSSIWYADQGTWKTTEYANRTGGVFVTHDRGVSWMLITLDNERTDWIIDYIEIVQVADMPVVFAANPAGTTYCSQDRGKSVSVVTVDWNGLPEGVDKSAIWVLAPVDALTNDGLLYLKTQQGLLKSTDKGRNWFY